MDYNKGVDAPPPYPGRPGENVPQQPVFQQPPPVHAYGPGQPQVTVVVPHLQYGTHPLNLTCPNCGAQVVTATKTQPGLLTYLLCGMCIIFGCWAGCCLIPFCVPECQDVEHTCPNCKAFLGMNRRL